MVSKGLIFLRWLGFYYVISKDWRSDSWGIYFCFFYFIDIRNFLKGKIKKLGVFVIFKLFFRVKESFWILEVFILVLIRSIRKYLGF